MITLVVGGSKTANAEFRRDDQPIRLDGVPVWVSTDSTVVEVAPSADGMTVTLNAVGPGDAQITASVATTTEGVLTAQPIDVHVDLPVPDSVPVLAAVASPKVHAEIEVQCPNCGKTGMVPDATVGRRLHCKVCKNVFVAHHHQERIHADATAARPCGPQEVARKLLD